MVYTKKRKYADKSESTSSKKTKASKKKAPKVNVRTGGYLGKELKFHDVHCESVVPLSGMGDPAALCLNGIDIGNGPSERIGRKYTIKKINIVGAIKRARLAGGVIPTWNSCWVALVQDTQTNGAQCSASEVYTYPSGGYAHLPLRNLQESSRFKVLGFVNMEFDTPNTIVTGTGPLTTETGGQVRHFRFDKDVNIPVLCSATGGTVSSIVDNSLHLVMGSAKTAAAPDQLELRASVRVRFEG